MENKETGEQIEDNDFEHIQKKIFHKQHLGTTCLHCYCGRQNVNGNEHMVCCMCGHRSLVNPITY